MERTDGKMTGLVTGLCAGICVRGVTEEVDQNLGEGGRGSVQAGGYIQVL